MKLNFDFKLIKDDNNMLDIVKLLSKFDKDTLKLLHLILIPLQLGTFL